MADERKKPKSVEDILKEYKGFHHTQAKPKKFGDRVKALERFHDSDSGYQEVISRHVENVVMGNPSDPKNPGAYVVAHQKLDKAVKGDSDVLKDEDKLTEILESYVDTFLDKAKDKDSFKKTMAHAEKKVKAGEMSKKKLRELKGQLMSQFYSEDGRSPTNILTEQYIKGLKGKKKSELIEKLKSIGEGTKRMYVANLVNDATGDLLSDLDRGDMADYVDERFKKQGWSHKKAHVMRDVREMTQHYTLLLAGNPDSQLDKSGYKHKMPQPKKDK